jgi:hypothetical protein
MTDLSNFEIVLIIIFIVILMWEVIKPWFSHPSCKVRPGWGGMGWHGWDDNVTHYSNRIEVEFKQKVVAFVDNPDEWDGFTGIFAPMSDYPNVVVEHLRKY